MLDNFGLGEFLLLAFFALLFFGPERLPQIGARLGRWLAKLTQYSKAFMTQWTEEAMAIQDAVQEVRGIRDEIRAAQAEISDSLHTARQDITQTIDEARGTIREATPSAQAVLETGEGSPPQPATAEEGEKFKPAARVTSGEEEAIEKTQQIVDQLIKKRGPPAEIGAEIEAASEEVQVGGDVPQPVASADEPEVEDEAYQRNLQAIQEIMQRDTERAAEKTARETEVAKEAEEPEIAAEVESAPQLQASLPEHGEENEPEAERESAFDKTQRILDRLLKKETVSEGGTPGPDTDTPLEPGAVPAQPESAVPASEEEGPSGVTPFAEAAEEPAKVERSRTTQGAHRAKGWEGGVSYGQFTKLSIQVTQLERELRALREELQALRAGAAGQATLAQVNEADQSTLSLAEESSEAISMEEVA